jgi:hypothetical protein
VKGFQQNSKPKLFAAKLLAETVAKNSPSVFSAKSQSKNLIYLKTNKIHWSKKNLKKARTYLGICLCDLLFNSFHLHALCGINLGKCSRSCVDYRVIYRLLQNYY